MLLSCVAPRSKRAAASTRLRRPPGCRRDLPAGQQVPIESLPPAPLWNKWPVLTLFIVLLITEWILRKRRGMP